MKKDQKYYGEVWFAGEESIKQFAVLSYKDDDLLLETNLCAPSTVYKQPQILGVFTGLGYITFIDCRIQLSSSGMVETRIYSPKYSFVGANHFVDAVNTKISEFSVINDAIVEWVNHYTWYDHLDDKLLYEKFEDLYLIDDIGLEITISHYLNFHSKRTELHIKNYGSILFKKDEPVDILEAISIYDQFQKILQLLFGRSAKFERFSFKCLSCEEWQQVYYNDKRLTKSTNAFVHTNYKKVKFDLNKILNAVYLNNSFQFCLDKLMENFITTHSSHNKRFTNSITSFEAFGKLYSGHKSNNLSKFIKHYKTVFVLVGKFKDEEWKLFPSKVVRSRDYHVHSNTANKNVYSEFELLYISFLFDFVIGYLLLETLEVSNDLLQKFIVHGNSAFIDMKRTNEILGRNSLLNIGTN
ncbi:ApeA N-terminal domain 1-containing protein [Arenibacter certesii]|uniref:ApeA N-terminal domain-containing protein n=1 Tax=Arenibacter certesii TaxID=228955 RepID=A0A918J7A3_9FLAO|nr:HEPN domain-containing protein [Arenibacter certesii]GGW49877.1 hypothetical protein GCM10007383_37210 [Arenibacter certesii]